MGGQQQRQVKCLTSQPKPEDLLTLKDLVETGKVTPFIDRTYPLHQVPQAIDDLEQRRIKGKVAITI